ncbi:MAG: ferredoxin [Acidimicrobiales bacterium]|nr:ferredoxin [Acidimicrobiales bacterium]
MTMRVRIEREVCTGAGDCARAVPEVFVMADDGLAMVQEGGTALGEDAGGFTHWAEVPEGKEAAVEQAAAACPGTCIVTEQSVPDPEPEPEPELEVTGPPPRSSIPKRIAFRLRRLFS